MKKSMILSMILCLFFMGCGVSEKAEVKQKLTIPDIFKTQIVKFLEDGTKINANSSGSGITLATLQESLINVQTSYEMSMAAWPEGFAETSKPKFDRAIKGWILLVELWKLKIQEKDEPTEPDVNGYQGYVDYDPQLIQLTRGPGFIVKEYRGKKYFPFDKNVPILLSITGSLFAEGRKVVMQELSK